MPGIEVSSSAKTDPVAGFKPGTKAEAGGKTGKHLLRGRPPAVSLHSQLVGSREKHLPPASWQPAAPPRAAAASQGKRRSLEAQPCPGRDGETVAGGKTLPSHPFFPHTPALCVSQGRPAAPAAGHSAGLGASSRQSRQGSRGGEGLTGQPLQGRSTAPASTQGMGFRVCTFLSSSTPPAPNRSATAAAKERSPRVRLVKKQAFILHVLLTVTAWRHCSCQSYYETNQVPDSGLALPHPQESQHCTKLYLQGKQSETVSPKTPCNSEENVQDKCDSYALCTARLPTGCSQDWWKPRASCH